MSMWNARERQEVCIFLGILALVVLVLVSPKWVAALLGWTIDFS